MLRLICFFCEAEAGVLLVLRSTSRTIDLSMEYIAFYRTLAELVNSMLPIRLC